MTDDPPDDRPRIDTTVPHSARVWNYWLGGREHYEVDRIAGDRYAAAFPEVVATARAARAFVGRAVAYLSATAGVEQFLDVGAGLPAAENIHEIAQRVTPTARVVYVDNDPLVIAHARALLVSGPHGAADYLLADLREPEAILQGALRTLDLTRPVGLILAGVLGHIDPYQEARSLVRRLMAGLPSGSHLVVSTGTGVLHRSRQRGMRLYNASGALPFHLRTPRQIAALFTGLELVSPGVVSCPRWRPTPGTAREPAQVDAFCAVGRKP